MVPKDGRIFAALQMSNDAAWKLNHVRVRLAKAYTATPDADRTLADFTECDFHEYFPISNPTYAFPFINGINQAEMLSAPLTWTAGPGLAAPQTILAMYLDMECNNAAHFLFWFKRVSPTVTLSLPGEQFIRLIDLFTDDIVAYD